jgi:hypothetical protein
MNSPIKIQPRMVPEMPPKNRAVLPIKNAIIVHLNQLGLLPKKYLNMFKQVV